MKKILFILLIFTSTNLFAQVKVNSEGDVIPTGNYPAVKSKNLKGTVHFFQTLAQRDSLKANFRDTATIAYVYETSKFYYLFNGIQNSDWTELILAGYADGRISGGFVSWTGTGLNFDIQAAVFRYGGIIYHSRDTMITLNAADVTYSRIDLFALDTTNGGQAIKVTGTPAPTPIAPQVSGSQIALTTGITLNVGDTIPSNVSIQVIYNENVEWATGVDGTVTANYNNTVNPFIGSKAALISSYSNIGRLIFTRSGTGVIDGSEVLKMHISLRTPLGSRKLSVGFFHSGSVPSSNIIPITANNGLDPTKVNQYQTVAIPRSAFTFSDPSYSRLIIYENGYDTSGTGGFYLDDIELQSGINNIPNQTDYSNKADSVTIVSGSYYWWAKGIKHLIGVAGVDSSAYRSLTVSADSTRGILHSLKGVPDSFEIWADGLVSDVVTNEQLADSLGKITLQRAFDNSINNANNPIINGHGSDLSIDSSNTVFNTSDTSKITIGNVRWFSPANTSTSMGILFKSGSFQTSLSLGEPFAPKLRNTYLMLPQGNGYLMTGVNGYNPDSSGNLAYYPSLADILVNDDTTNHGSFVEFPNTGFHNIIISGDGTAFNVGGRSRQLIMVQGGNNIDKSAFAALNYDSSRIFLSALRLSTNQQGGAEAYISNGSHMFISDSAIFPQFLTPSLPTGNYYLPVKVNGVSSDTLGNINVSCLPYRVYTVLLDQSGTSPPTATILQNTLVDPSTGLPITITWSRTGAGSYTATSSSGDFGDINKMFVLAGKNNLPIAWAVQSYRSGTGTVELDSYNTPTSTSDNILNSSGVKYPFEIRVYP